MENIQFFEDYAKMENLWENFISQEVSCRNLSALGMTALRICYYVVKNPNCALKEIALSLNISLGSASQMVRAMTESGLLKCSVNSDDRRRICIIPTVILSDFFDRL